MADDAREPEGSKAIEWPNTFRSREELDSMLEAGEVSGVSDLTGEEIIERALKKVRDRRANGS